MAGTAPGTNVTIRVLNGGFGLAGVHVAPGAVVRTRPRGQYPVTGDFSAGQRYAANLFSANGLVSQPVKVAGAVLPEINEIVAASRQ